MVAEPGVVLPGVTGVGATLHSELTGAPVHASEVAALKLPIAVTATADMMVAPWVKVLDVGDSAMLKSGVTGAVMVTVSVLEVETEKAADPP